jgi:hypothetical protein
VTKVNIFSNSQKNKSFLSFFGQKKSNLPTVL